VIKTSGQLVTVGRRQPQRCATWTAKPQSCARAILFCATNDGAKTKFSSTSARDPERPSYQKNFNFAALWQSVEGLTMMVIRKESAKKSHAKRLHRRP